MKKNIKITFLGVETKECILKKYQILLPKQSVNCVFFFLFFFNNTFVSNFSNQRLNL